jgi:hypothetical protein
MKLQIPKMIRGKTISSLSIQEVLNTSFYIGERFKIIDELDSHLNKFKDYPENGKYFSAIQAVVDTDTQKLLTDPWEACRFLYNGDFTKKYLQFYQREYLEKYINNILARPAWELYLKNVNDLLKKLHQEGNLG